MIRFTNFFQIIGTLASLAGIVFYFLGFTVVAIICGLLSLLDSVVQRIWGRQTNLVTEMLTIIIGLAIALIVKIPLLPCIAVSLCIGSILMLVLGWLLVFLARI